MADDEERPPTGMSKAMVAQPLHPSHYQPVNLLARDPHVQTLYFKVTSGDAVSYVNAPPVDVTNDLGRFQLADGRLEVEPAEHFADQVSALEAIKPFLRAWEVETDLTPNVGMIRFEFERAHVVDRTPPPPGGPMVIQVPSVSVTLVVEKVQVHLKYGKYPKPPGAFQRTLDVDRAYRRWMDYRDGKEKLQSMAYTVLTIVQSAAGGRSKAAQVFKIDKPVLDLIGELSTTKGDPSTARKAPPSGVYVDLTNAEKQWLEFAVKRVILRLGEHASGAPPSPITMQDFPAT